MVTMDCSELSLATSEMTSTPFPDNLWWVRNNSHNLFFEGVFKRLPISTAFGLLIQFSIAFSTENVWDLGMDVEVGHVEPPGYSSDSENITLLPHLISLTRLYPRRQDNNPFKNASW